MEDNLPVDENANLLAEHEVEPAVEGQEGEEEEEAPPAPPPNPNEARALQARNANRALHQAFDYCIQTLQTQRHFLEALVVVPGFSRAQKISIREHLEDFKFQLEINKRVVDETIIKLEVDDLEELVIVPEEQVDIEQLPVNVEEDHSEEENGQ